MKGESYGLLMLDRYRNYRKEHDKSLFETLKRWLKRVILCLGITFLSIPGGLFCSANNLNELIWFCVMAGIAAVAVGDYCTEPHLVRISMERMERRFKYWRDFRMWLESNSISGREAIQTIKGHLENRINEAKAERKEAKQDFEKWLQTLAIPVTLAIITTTINRADSIERMISDVTGILLTFLIFCIFCISFGGAQIYSGG